MYAAPAARHPRLTILAHALEKSFLQQQFHSSPSSTARLPYAIGYRYHANITGFRYLFQDSSLRAPSRVNGPPDVAARLDHAADTGTQRNAAPATFSISRGWLGGSSSSRSTPLVEAVITTAIGLTLVFVGGIAYLAWYKKNVLDKMELAFAAGFDPALELARSPERGTEVEGLQIEHMRRKEQDLVERIINGTQVGQYFILLGPKGTGKTSMIFHAMQAVQAEGVAMCEAHPDLEVFRLRLGKALDYEFNEDTQTGLFQRRDPREGSAALDVERAMSKLEKVALRYSRRMGRPLVLIINNVHFFHNEEEGRNILLQLQQRAESWAASGILTMVFSADDSWPLFVMRKNASRLRVLSVYDLKLSEAVGTLARMRASRQRATENLDTYKEAVSIVGGRHSYLSKVAEAEDMLDQAQTMLAVEKAWLQSQIGLIPDCDDDVMDEQKWSTSSWLLLREFVRQRREDERRRAEAIAAGARPEGLGELSLPKISFYRCRQIMTRTDFLEDLDRANIIAIDAEHDVTPDSLLLLLAATQVVEEDGFDGLLDKARARVDEIEGLHRTRELIFKPTQTDEHVRIAVLKSK